jgi:large conductance mechanosensitive channel
MILKDFREFAVRGNVIDLAVGVIIGAAFGKIVASFVNDIVMPLINPLIQTGDWRSLVIGPGIKIGSFLSAILDFVVVAFVIFLAVRAINRMKAREEAKPSAPPEIPADVRLLGEIRDLLKSKSV